MKIFVNIHMETSTMKFSFYKSCRPVPGALLKRGLHYGYLAKFC